MSFEIERGAWHLDKRFSLGTIISLATLIGWCFLYVADLDKNVATFQAETRTINEIQDVQIAQLAKQSVDTRQELLEKLDDIRASLKEDSLRLEGKIDRIIEREINKHDADKR